MVWRPSGFRPNRLACPGPTRPAGASSINEGVRDMNLRKNSPAGPIVAGAAALVLVLAATFTMRASAGEVVPISNLAKQTHIHGLAVDPLDGTRLLIATHHGVFSAGPDGKAERISAVQDFMGFSPHPRDPRLLYASGHPAQGGNLGFVASSDQGSTWTQISPGANGPVDFHQLTISPADPNTLYGAFRGLQLSRDGGRTWTVTAPEPERLIDLAASAKSPDTLYAATEAGLFLSKDAGKTWRSILEGAPVSLVEVTPAGTIYAFVIGRGLVRGAEDDLTFATVSEASRTPPLMHLAVDPNNPDRLFAAAGRGQMLKSDDRGRTWTAFHTGL